jgi:hypothetical protein
LPDAKTLFITAEREVLEAIEVGMEMGGGPATAHARFASTQLLKRNLNRSTDWIVLNVTMDVLAGWAGSDRALANGSSQSWSDCARTGAGRWPSVPRSV